MGKGVCRLHETLILHIRTYDDAARVEIIVQCFGLPQELRAEDDIPAPILLTDTGREAHRDGGLDDHDSLGVHLHHQPDDRLHRRGIEEILPAVVVGGGRDDHKVGVPIGCLPVQRSRQIELFLCEVFFDAVVLNGRFSPVDELHLFRHDVHRRDMVVLAQQDSNGQADVARTRDSDVQFFECFHGFCSYDTNAINCVIDCIVS